MSDADGCGGFESGRRASDLAVATLQRLFASPEPTLPGAPQGEPLAAALHLANQAIREDIAATPGSKRDSVTGECLQA